MQNGLWRAASTYSPAELFAVGFSVNIPSFGNVKSGAVRLAKLATDSAALVLYGYAFFARTGDKMHFNITSQTALRLSTRRALKKHNSICFAPLKKGPQKRAGPVVSIVVSLPSGLTIILLQCVRLTLRPHRDPNSYLPCQRPSAIFQ